MRNLTVILGAGASISAGLPALNRIFEDSSVQAYLADEANEFDNFMSKYVWTPRLIESVERWKSLNLEEVLTMLRLWENDSQSPINFAKNFKYQKQLLGCVYHSVYSDKKDNGCRDYNQLISFCDERFDRITWASFNWDAKFEQAFFYTFKGCADGGRLPSCHANLQDWEGTNEKHMYLKLHGSVTWFSDAGGNVINRRFGKVAGAYPVRAAWDDFLCGNSGALEPMIAEPSFLKHDRIRAKPFLRSQWRSLDLALGESDLVLVVGFSLPDGDAMAKQSLLTTVARNPNAPFVVVDPDKTKQVMPRYERLLGSGRLDQRPQSLTAFLVDPRLPGV